MLTDLCLRSRSLGKTRCEIALASTLWSARRTFPRVQKLGTTKVWPPRTRRKSHQKCASSSATQCRFPSFSVLRMATSVGALLTSTRVRTTAFVTCLALATRSICAEASQWQASTRCTIVTTCPPSAARIRHLRCPMSRRLVPGVTPVPTLDAKWIAWMDLILCPTPSSAKSLATDWFTLGATGLARQCAFPRIAVPLSSLSTAGFPAPTCSSLTPLSTAASSVSPSPATPHPNPISRYSASPMVLFPPGRIVCQ
mmetsp:Transcript_21818/g.49703  ORF Transcript_21818/g.49703 Transcript_21818/m.49703 type:complete len:255 (+) Transcript_21818:243-1007(+)